MKKILFLSQKTVGRNMSGLGIRVWELAKALAKEHKVIIVTPSGSDLSWPNVDLHKSSPGKILSLLFRSEIIIVQIFFLSFHWLLLAWLLGKKIVVDAYSPFYLEHLEVYKGNVAKSGLMQRIDACRIKFLMKIGDFFLCASERQERLWQEWLASVGRGKTPISVVPTGIRGEAPKQRKRVFKEVIPGIGLNDKVVLWSSGIWPWLDPLSAIRAISLIPDEKIKLVFFGLKVVDEMIAGGEQPQLQEAVKLANDLGLCNRRVFFIYERKPYDEIGDYLLDADVALNLHFDTQETRYAFRGRLLDYIWAALPMVTTKGDVLAEAVAVRTLGIVVDYIDEKSIAAGISKLINDNIFYNQCRKNLKEYAKGLYWTEVSSPLRQYCASSFNCSSRRSLANLAFLINLMVKMFLLSGLYLMRYQWKIS